MALAFNLPFRPPHPPTARTSPAAIASTPRSPPARPLRTLASTAVATGAAVLLALHPGCLVADGSARAELLPPVTSGCYNGEGPACEDAAEGNPLIRKLQEQSRERKEENFKMMQERYWEEGYKDYFSFGYFKELVKNPDGTWTLKDPESFLEKATKRGKR